MELRRDLDSALAAAMIGSNVMMGYYGKDYNVGYKEAALPDPHAMIFTEADLHTQEAVLEFLTSRYWPEYGILAEEGTWCSNPSRLERPFHWQVDPIDGTMGFTKGTGNFGISIALVSKTGKSMVGVLQNPARHLLAYACEGMPAIVNGRPLVPSPRTGKDVLRIIVSSNQLQKPAMQRALELFPRKEVLTAESNVTKAITVFRGEADLFFGLSGVPVYTWDLAAVACIAQQSTCSFTDLDGNSVDLNCSDTICPNGFILSNGLVHQYAIERLSEWRPEP